MSCNKNRVNNLTVVMRVTINYFLDCPQIKISFWSFQVSLTTLWDLALPEYLTKRGEERLYTNYKWQNKEVFFTYNIQYCLKVKTQKQIRSKTFTRQNKNTTRNAIRTQTKLSPKIMVQPSCNAQSQQTVAWTKSQTSAQLGGARNLTVAQFAR